MFSKPRLRTQEKQCSEMIGESRQLGLGRAEPVTLFVCVVLCINLTESRRITIGTLVILRSYILSHYMLKKSSIPLLLVAAVIFAANDANTLTQRGVHKSWKEKSFFLFM